MRITPTLLLAALALPVTTAAAAPRARPSRPASRPAARASAPSASTAANQSLPIRRVVVYSNGVAYVERRGLVTGNASVELPFKQSQMDDVLKSMVVLDPNGSVGAVSYASTEPPSTRLAEIPFRVGAESSAEGGLGGVGTILKQLQGARVTVTTARRSATGAVLTVEQHASEAGPEGKPSVARTVVIATDAGDIESFDLAAVTSVRLVDDTARRNVAQFADATASARRRDANTIEVTSRGAGSRELVVGYTVAAPVWKTSYRVVLDDKGTPFFQGWAIVDNVSEDDWSNVSLSLVSGTPISFVPRLQQAFYRRRPVLPLPQGVEVSVPAADQGAVAGSETVTVTAGAAVNSSIANRAVSQLPLDGRNVQQLLQIQGGASMAENIAISSTPYHPSLESAVVSESSGVSAAASGQEVGDLFEYRVDTPVTVDRNRSALIPIVQTRLEGARVSFYDESVRAERPLSALRLKNTSDMTLEAGPLTVFEGDAYVGEALLDRLKPGEERFVSFALDLGTLVSSKSDAMNGPVFLAKAARGTFETSYYEFARKTYTVRNQTPRPRVVYVSHPMRDGWSLADDSAKPAQKTTHSYRFRLELAPNAVETLTVSERKEALDTFDLSDLTYDEVRLFVERRLIDDAARAALTHIVEMRARIAQLEGATEARDAEIEAIGEDQSRLRDNIEALGGKPDAKALVARYIAKADAQESRLDELERSKRADAEEVARLRAELAAAVASFTIDRRIEPGS